MVIIVPIPTAANALPIMTSVNVTDVVTIVRSKINLALDMGQPADSLKAYTKASGGISIKDTPKCIRRPKAKINALATISSAP